MGRMTTRLFREPRQAATAEKGSSAELDCVREALLELPVASETHMNDHTSDQGRKHVAVLGCKLDARHRWVQQAAGCKMLGSV